MTEMIWYGDVTFWCARCRGTYFAGHVCPGPQGSPLHRAIQRIRLGEKLFTDEAAAALPILEAADSQSRSAGE